MPGETPAFPYIWEDLMAIEPKSELARYAFGYSDKKPSWRFWLIQGALTAFCIWQIFTIE